MYHQLYKCNLLPVSSVSGVLAACTIATLFCWHTTQLCTCTHAHKYMHCMYACTCKHTQECLYSTSWYSYGTGTVRLFKASLAADSRQEDSFSMDFLPAMAFDHSSIAYKIDLKNRRVHNLLAMSVLDWSSARTYWQWAGPKFHY